VPSVYLDYNATTPLDPAVRLAMEPYLTELWGNPSSVHLIGREARAALDDFRDRSARVLGCKPSEIVFTSGGTEANNLAVLGTARSLRDNGAHIITSTIEHHAVLHCFDYLERKEGFEVTRLPVDSAGRVDPRDLKSAIRTDTIMASIMAANNETGTVQEVAEMGAICRERGVIFHTDAVQWFGKMPFSSVNQFNADLVSICSHKFYGPRGAGALFIRSPLLPDPILFGGAHENERRAGTENLPVIAGFTVALESFVVNPVFEPVRLKPLLERLLKLIDGIENATIRGSREKKIPNTVSFTVSGCDGIALMAALDLDGICASSGSACSAGSLEPSHVMAAMGVSPTEANALVRLSMRRETRDADIDHVSEILPPLVNRLTRSR